jgi:single-stranded DNA-binding protein
MLNVVALRGCLTRPATLRSLPSGATVVSLDLTVRRDGGEKADSVPVVWHDPPGWAGDLVSGTEVVIVGHVARRFFRNARGGTESRTEVVASAIIPLRHAKRVERALHEAAARIEEALPVRRARLAR